MLVKSIELLCSNEIMIPTVCASVEHHLQGDDDREAKTDQRHSLNVLR